MKPTEEIEPKTHKNKFLAMLQTLRAGASLEEANDKMAEVVKAVRAIGKSGKLTVTFVFKPAGTSGRAIEILDDIVPKCPTLKRDSDILYANDDGSVQREDPKQMLLKARGVTIMDGGKEDNQPVQEIAAN